MKDYMNPLVILISIVLVLIAGYAVFSYVRIQRLIAIGTDLVVTTQPFEYHPENPRKTVLFVGDSAAVGVGASDPKKSIAGLISASHPDWDITNIGISGTRTPGLMSQLESVAGKSFDLLFIQIGGNDSVRFTPRAELTASINAVLAKAKTISPHVILYSTGNVGDAPFFPRPLAWLWEGRTLMVREVFAAAAAQHSIIYVDLFRPHAQDPFYLEPLKYHATDLFHPSDFGYAYWLEAIEQELAAGTIK